MPTTLSSQPLVTTDRIRGVHVLSADGEKVGKIEDLVIDKASGAVAYVILGSSGLFGLDEHHRAIPWADLRYEPEHEGFSVSLLQSQVRELPELDYAALDGWVGRQSAAFI